MAEMAKLSARVLVPRASERLPRGKNVALLEWFTESPTWQCSDRRRTSAGGILAVELRNVKNANSENLPEDTRFDLDLPDIAEVWRRGSVISSWLLDLAASALAADPKLAGFEGVVEDSGEGRWTVMAAIDEAVPADVLSAALYTRFRSRREHTFAEKILSAMRKGFGAHVEPKSVATDLKAKAS